MRSRSQAVDHDAAVARRLELLTSELAGVRDDSAERADSWVPHGHTRIRLVPGPDPDPDLETSEVDPRPVPPVARMPGRHASRRTVAAPSGWVGLVPDPVRGRVGVGPGQLAVVAVVAVVGLVATCWFLVRSGAHEVGAPVAVHTPAQPLARPHGSTAPVDTAADGTGPSASRSKVVVDVAGKVRRPGIAVLRSGARVVDAIRAAGGARPGVDLGSLNLAQVLTDGEQIVVGGSVVTPTGVAAAASGAPGTATLVDLNTADQTALESLPEVGPVTAQAIIAWRTEHGGFSAVSQLLDVDGIGDATLAEITPYVTL
jgi:competence protein ComEA